MFFRNDFKKFTKLFFGILIAVCTVARLVEYYNKNTVISATTVNCKIIHGRKFQQRSLLNTYEIHTLSRQEETELQYQPQKHVNIKYTVPSKHITVCYRNESTTTTPKTKRRPTTIVVVHSSLNNYENRANLRREFCENSRDNFIQPFFVIADGKVVSANSNSTGDTGKKNVTSKTTIHHQIRAEMHKFGDIFLLDNIEDNYHHMSYKARAWIAYLTKNIDIPRYKHAKFILKMDDDVSVDWAELASLLAQFQKQKRVILCRVFLHGQITRNPKSKWYLSSDEYRPSSLGTFCQGMAYAFSADLLPKMNENLRKVQYLWMDDWYVTHALMNATRALFFDISPHIISTNDADELTMQIGKERLEFAPIFAHFRPSEEYPPTKRSKIWNEIRSNSTCNSFSL